MSEERRLAVLRAIVHDYVQTSEPVGSKALLERHALGVSAATIRNDMAALEEDGLITAPHTSAGRVPTDAGYRAFVDQIAEIKPMSAGERAAIEAFLHGAVDLDDVVERTVRLLASLTHQVAVMQYPSLTRSAVRHIELVGIGDRRVMVVLILDTGRVEQRVVDASVDVIGPQGEAMLARLRSDLNASAQGQRLADAGKRLDALIESLPEPEQTLATHIVAALAGALVEEREERVVLAGTANLARFGNDFPTSIYPVLEALEEHVVLLKLLSTMAQDSASGDVAVLIGHEHQHVGLASTSLVTTGYGAGGLGVLGPTRMDYPLTMASVRAVARYVAGVLNPRPS